MSNTPFWKLRRLASRAQRVYERRKSESPAIAAHGTSTIPKAQAFASAYDACVAAEFNWKKELKEGKSAAAALLKHIRAWSPILQGAVSGFKASDFGKNPDVPDDIMADAEQILEASDQAVDASGNPLPFVADLQSELDTAFKSAEKELKEAEAADKLLQSLQADVREKAEAFDGALVLFRRTLASTIGRKDKDYQKLRAEHAGGPDDDDDDKGTPPAPAGTP